MLPKFWSFTAKIIVLVTTVLLLTKSTDADLVDKESILGNTISAVTLDFSTRDTANNNQKSSFFSIQGMKKGGFQVNSVRITNEGELPVDLDISAQQTGGDSATCDQLHLRLIKNWREITHQPLPEFRHQTSIDTNQTEDFVFSLELPMDSNAPPQSNCIFSITIKTKQSDSIRFFDEETLDNQVSIGG